MNIIVVVSDTFRLDHFPGFNKTEIFAPNLERFAQNAQVFNNCRLGSFPTVPARADIATGKFAFTFMGWDALPKSQTTMAECMSKAGYLTCGIADNPFLVRNGYGYDRGYQDFIWVRGQRAGPEGRDVKKTWTSENDCFAAHTFTEACNWIERNAEEKFFLYLDPWDPHEPWDPPAHYVKRYLPDYDGEQIYPAYWDVDESGVTERDLEIAHACYKGEITMIDHWFGRMMARIESLGLAEDTVVLFTSDHGFYFGEHNIFGKRRFLWDKKHPMNKVRFGERGYYYSCPLHQELTRVPFVMHHPKLEAKTHDCLLSLCDIAPTVIDMAGSKAPDDMHGRSLVPVLEGTSDAHRDILVSADADAQNLRSTSKAVDDVPREILQVCPATIFDGEWELVYAIEGDPHALYNAKTDPEHRKDVAKDHPEKVRKLHAKYVDWLERHGTQEANIAPRRAL
jgi:arylsulfatase A-like enzyme